MPGDTGILFSRGLDAIRRSITGAYPYLHLVVASKALYLRAAAWWSSTSFAEIQTWFRRRFGSLVRQLSPPGARSCMRFVGRSSPLLYYVAHVHVLHLTYVAASRARAGAQSYPRSRAAPQSKRTAASAPS